MLLAQNMWMKLTHKNCFYMLYIVICKYLNINWHGL